MSATDPGSLQGAIFQVTSKENVSRFYEVTSQGSAPLHRSRSPRRVTSQGSAPLYHSPSPRAAASSELSTPEAQRYLTLSTAELTAWEEQDADVEAWARLLAIVRDFEREGCPYFHARPFLTRAYLVLEQWHISGTANPEAPATQLYHGTQP